VRPMTMTTTSDRKRQLWQDIVERAVQTAQQGGKPLTVEAVLDSCGVFHWSPYRQRAHAYATKMIDTKGRNQ
jgi:hypothetical protein